MPHVRFGGEGNVGRVGVGRPAGADEPLVWIAEQLDLIAHIDQACPGLGAKGGPSVGELAVAVAIQRACAPGPKCELGEFLDASLARIRESVRSAVESAVEFALQAPFPDPSQVNTHVYA